MATASAGFTPKIKVEIKRAPAMDRGTPIATPIATGVKASRSTIWSMSPLRAPSAMRMLDFVCSPRHTVGNCAVETDGCQSQPQRREQAQQGGESPFVTQFFIG